MTVLGFYGCNRKWQTLQDGNDDDDDDDPASSVEVTSGNLVFFSLNLFVICRNRYIEEPG